GDEHEAVRLTPRTTGDEHEAVRLRPRKEKRWGKGSSKTQEALWNTLPRPNEGPCEVDPPQGPRRTGRYQRVGKGASGVDREAEFDASITGIGPPGGHDLAPGVEVDAFRPVRMGVTEEGRLPPAEGVVGDRYRDGNVDTHHPHLHLVRSEEHTSELQSRFDLVCRLLPEKKKKSAHAVPA